MSAVTAEAVIRRALHGALAERQKLSTQTKQLERLLRQDLSGDERTEVANLVLALYLELSSMTAVARLVNALGHQINDLSGVQPFTAEHVECFITWDELPGHRALRAMAAAHLEACRRA